jgi:hypothetical protein
MSESFRALVSDMYVNQKLSVKLDLPKNRETILDLFERVRREHPMMEHFKRDKEELALESSAGAFPHRWLAVKSNTVRAGEVNGESLRAGYDFHRRMLEIVPFYLSVSPLDIDSLELLYGFDLAAGGNHDAIVCEALFADSAFAHIADAPGAACNDCQPVLGLSLGDGTQAIFEVKTRAGATSDPDGASDPISVYLTIRRKGPVKELKDVVVHLAQLIAHGEELLRTRLVPHVIQPLRRVIVSGGA